MPATTRTTLAEQRYAAEGCTLKALGLLSLGLKNGNGMPTFDPSVLPWSAALKATSLKMTSKELRAKVIRHSTAKENVLNAPCQSQWPVARATKWLQANPIAATADVAFIQATIAHQLAVTERANIAQPGASSAPPPAVMSKGCPWVQNYPYLMYAVFKYALLPNNTYLSFPPSCCIKSLFNHVCNSLALNARQSDDVPHT